MAWEALAYTPFVAGAVMLALAGWLLWLRFSSPATRAFAFFLVLRGTVTLTLQAAAVAGSGAFGFAGASFWFASGTYFALALVPALAYFLVTYLSGRRRPVVRGLIVAAGALVEVLYLLDHCLAACPTPGGLLLGPLALLFYGTALAYGVAGLLLAREAARHPEGARRSAARLVALAFLLHAAFDGTLLLATLGIGGGPSGFAPSAWVAPSLAAYGLGLLPGAVGFAVLLREGRRRSAGTGDAARIGLAGVAVVASGVAATVLPLVDEGFGPFATLLLAVWRLALPALVVYALLRHRLFDLDVKLRWTVRRGTVAGVFIGVFAAVAEVAGNYFSDEHGLLLGGMAAGLLFFLLAPLERVAQRLAHAAVPPAPETRGLPHEARLQLYREQAAVAWADGVLGTGERRVLDHLRERLGLTWEEAALAERDAGGQRRTEPVLRNR